MATATGTASGATAQGRFIAGHARTDGEKLLEQEDLLGPPPGLSNRPCRARVGAPRR